MANVETRDRVHDDLSIAYDGPGLAAGTMDVRDLAPALLGLSGLFQEANRTINPTAPDVALEIRATSTGSFHVDMQLAVTTGVALMAGGPVTALANLKAIIIDPVTGLISYLKRRHAEPDPPTAVLESGDVSVEWGDGARVIYPRDVLLTARSVTVRREIERVLKPLESPDCDRVILSSSTTDSITIEREDLPAFAVVASGDNPVDENVVPMTLAVVAPAFDNKKWRVSDGGASFWVSILDPAFQARIDARERFAKGDYLRARVRFRQFATDDGLRLEREVVEVIEHRVPDPPPDELPLR